MQVLVRDETANGAVTHELTLDVLTETLTVRELIRSRVYQEVDDHNRRVRQGREANAPMAHGLVRPPDAGQRHAREVDFSAQFEVACRAFEQNGFFVLVGDRQAESLDEPLDLRHDTAVSFVRLTPLVGG